MNARELYAKLYCLAQNTSHKQAADFLEQQLAETRVLKARLEQRKEILWDTIFNFVNLRDARGVHDAAVEIQGIEIVLREMQ